MVARESSRSDAGPVTVVIPLFNGERYIADTLTSLQQQTVPAAEVIVVDDGSTDDGVRIARQHPVGALVIEQRHLGVAVARNRGLAEAGTPWITFLDQDDLWAPTRLERLLVWLDEHPDERIVATSEIAFSTTEETDRLTAADPLVGHWASVLVPERTSYEDLCARVDTTGSGRVERHDHLALLRGPITATTSFLADALLLRLAGGFAPHALAMDDYWLLVNAARLQPIAHLDQPTVLYRVHLGATSRTTRLALPFLSSAVALRLGGGLVRENEDHDAPAVGPLHEHLFDELLRSPDYEDPRVRRIARHLGGLLWPDGKWQERAKAQVRRRADWLVPIVRKARGRRAAGQ